ncbi:MAG TPA: hypothetical protein VGL21_04910 [Jatrophihabitantaceae bacterium]
MIRLKLRDGGARRAVIIVAALTLLGLAAGIALDRIQGPRWNASTAVLLRISSVDSLLLTGQAAPVSVADQVDASALAVSQTALTRAAIELGESKGWTELGTRVSAEPAPSSHVILIKATAPDRDSAQHTADVVAATYVAIMREQLSAAAASMAPPSSPTDYAGSELQRRAQLLTGGVQPLQVFHTDKPTKLSGTQTPVTLGIVGLAAGALVVLALTFLRRTITKPREAQRLVELPAVGFDRPDGGAQASRLVHGLLDDRPDGALMVCPVDVDAEKAALELAEWTRGRSDAAQAERVQLLAEPAVAVLGTRPTPGDAAALLLVVPAGTRNQVLADAVALLAIWRPVDAVVVTT